MTHKIPDDLREKAFEIARRGIVHAWNVIPSQGERFLAEAIAQALAAERERCAKIAEKLAADRVELERSRGFGPKSVTNAANQYWCEEIASAIRSPS